MSETVEHVAIHKSPPPASYGDALAEYRAVRDGSGAGLLDLSARARIEVSGAEAVQFLNGLVTNDVKTLADGAWMAAAFPNPQGRLIASTRVLRRGDSFLFDADSISRERLFKTLERFTLAGDFRVADSTEETAQLSLQGARAAELLATALGPQAAQVERWRVVTLPWNNGTSLSIIRATHTAEDGFDLFVERAQSAALWEALMASGARPVGLDALEILRIEAGLPRYGIDMDETNVVTEAGLDEAVSYTKGCYTGQEIIARIHWRGHVAKKLAGLVVGDSLEIERGARLLTKDDKEIGRVTSATFSPHLGQTVALAYVKYDYLTPGTQARIVTGDASGEASGNATVAELPFVRGSWFDTDSAKETTP